MSYFNLFLSGNHLKIAKIRPPIDIFKCILNYDDRDIKLSFFSQILSGIASSPKSISKVKRYLCFTIFLINC